MISPQARQCQPTLYEHMLSLQSRKTTVTYDIGYFVSRRSCYSQKFGHPRRDIAAFWLFHRNTQALLRFKALNSLCIARGKPSHPFVSLIHSRGSATEILQLLLY